MGFNYKVIIDTREKCTEHITDIFKKNNVKYEFKKLCVGDYRIQIDSEGSAYTPPIVIERKANLSELIGNLLDERDANGKTRLHRELDRSLLSGTRVILLIEDANWYEKMLKGIYISKANPKAIRGMILSLQARYPNVSIVGVSKEHSASYINWVLYYHLREKLKEYKDIA